jgi:hypothetical protein
MIRKTPLTSRVDGGRYFESRKVLSMIASLAGQCIRRRNLVVGAWVALLMALGAVQAFGCGQSPMSFVRQIVRL